MTQESDLQKAQAELQLEQTRGETLKAQTANAQLKSQLADAQIEEIKKETALATEKLESARKLAELSIKETKWIYPRIILIIAIWDILWSFIFLFFLYRYWPAATTTSALFSSDVLKVAALSGGAGGAVYASWAVVWHIEKADFEEHYVLWYFLRPFIGLGLGVIVVLLVLGGLLILTVNTGTGSPNLYGVAGVAALTGIAQARIIFKLDDLAKNLFSSSQTQKGTGTGTSGGTGGATVAPAKPSQKSS